MCTDLAEEGDERFAGGIHENKFIFRGRIWTVGVNSEGNFPGGIIHNEPIAAAGNEDGSLVNCEMGFFFKAKYLIHNRTSAAHLFSYITATYKPSKFEQLQSKYWFLPASGYRKSRGKEIGY